MSTQGTLETIALSLTRLLNPLEEELRKGRIRVLFAELGLEFPPELETKTAFVNALERAGAEVTRLPALVKELITAINANDYSKITSSGLELFSTIKTIIENVITISNELQSLGGTLPGISATDMNNFASNLPKKLTEYLIIKNIEGTLGFAEALEFIDVVERKEITSGGFSYTQRSLKINQLFHFLSAPGEHLKSLYDWGNQATFDGVKLFQKIEKLFLSVGLPIILDQSTNPIVLDLTYAELKPRLDLNPKGLELQLLDKIKVNGPVFSKDDWKIKLTLDASLGSGFRFVVQPNSNVTFIPPAGDVKGKVSLEWIAGNVNGSPYLLLGKAGGSRLEAKQFAIKGGIDFKWDTATNQAKGDFNIGGEIKGGKLLIDFSKGDGFLTKLLSGIKLDSDFDLGFGYSSKDGVYFTGSSTLIIQLANHIDLGPIQLSALSISIGLGADAIPIALALNLKAELGPLKIVVEQIGVKANLSFPSNQKGNLGPVNLNIGFQPPSGLGLSIDAGAVIGGGYLFFDFEKEEYAGVLELTIAGFISAKAIGLITTKMPDGSKGFSMLIIITAEFNPPFQLGYGFTLMGVGGLLGLNRTVLLDPLREGVRTGAINNIMFPQNVIANATRIISDLKTIFPPYEGKFLIGPMAKIGWGTPTLVSISFGLIIEIPGNIAILGVLSVILPDKAAAIVKIQVAFVGTIDFDKQMLTFDASLYESSILTMTLEGDMAVRLKWGDSPDFIFTVGGFHPSYTPPPLALPTLKRLAINILNTSIAKIRVECYQAITSNTVQFGARADIFFDLSVCSISGFIAFDALFQFSPFYFIISISAGFSLKVAGLSLLSVRVSMSLEGPTPWRAKGTGSVSLLFFDVSADFDKTWGEQRNTTLASKAILTELLTALNKKEQWSTLLSTNKNLYVSLRTLNEATESLLVLHPAGSLVVQQKLLPFTINIDKIGNQKVSDVKQISVVSAQSGSSSLQLKTVNEDFARAQYQNLSDAEKLSKPSFEKMPGGVEISMSGNLIKNGKLVRKEIKYELTVIDKEPTKKRNKFFALSGVLFTNFLKGNSVSKLAISKAYKTQLKPFEEKVELTQPGYTVAFQSNNKAFDVNATFESEMAAQTYMQTVVKQQPNLKSQVHIVPNFELQEI